VYISLYKNSIKKLRVCYFQKGSYLIIVK